MKKEIWKDIIGYEGLYQVSNLGRVKSLGNGGSNNSKERIMKLKIGSRGYYEVSLCKEGKHKTFTIHRLVAMTFIPNPQNYPCVNHKSEIKTDNRVDNLEWVTQKENSNYGTRNKRLGNILKEKKVNVGNKYRLGKKHTQESKDKMSITHKGKVLSQEHKEKCAKAHQKPILQLTKQGEFIKKFDSAKQAGEELNIFATSITACCKGKQKTTGGFKFKYLEEIKKAG